MTHFKRAAGLRRRTFILAAVLATSVTAFAFASPAMATPKGPYEVFKQCPAGAIAKISKESLCILASTTSGEFTIGSTTVPISKTLTLQGGAVPDGNPAEFFLVPALNGESLSKTELNVPGGLLNIVNCEAIKGNGIFEIIERASCKAVFENKTTGVTATTEIVANASNPALFNLGNLLGEKGSALTLPVRVHLKNPLLGNSCYIGSESSPIQLHLTTGTTSPPAPNKPITGNVGFFEEENLILSVTENKLVDNAWSAPAASGCGEFFSFLIDPIVDAKLGLPSAAGHNTAILGGELKATPALAVVASE
jgi:hypothetical protein